MKVVGIEIDSRKVIVVALERTDDGIVNYTGKYKPIKLEDDDVAENVRLFKNTLFATLDGFSPEVVVFLGRGTSGMFAASPISFKIEGLLQLYENADVCCTKPQTISAFFKKNELDVVCEFGYQKNALNVSYHYLKVN
jgi:Protein of unknown function (DUF3010)